ncbi:hypothetical protein CsSME_00019765 [Camellia sinensis var. sinensis]
MSSPSLVASERGFETPDMPCGCCEHIYWVIPKLGKLVFWQTMYVGGERQEEGFEISNSRLNQMDKTLYIGGVHITCRIWEVANETFQNQIPSAYKDSCCQMISRIKEMESGTHALLHHLI